MWQAAPVPVAATGLFGTGFLPPAYANQDIVYTIDKIDQDRLLNSSSQNKVISHLYKTECCDLTTNNAIFVINGNGWLIYGVTMISRTEAG